MRKYKIGDSLALQTKSSEKRGMNRVTDVALPEVVFREIEESLMSLWQDASEVGDRRFPMSICTTFLFMGSLSSISILRSPC